MLKSCHAKNTSLPQQISGHWHQLPGECVCTIIEFFQAHDEWVLLLLLLVLNKPDNFCVQIVSCFQNKSCAKNFFIYFLFIFIFIYLFSFPKRIYNDLHPPKKTKTKTKKSCMSCNMLLKNRIITLVNKISSNPKWIIV